MREVRNPIDRAWRNRWRSLTIIGCALAFWMGLRSPVSQRVNETPKDVLALQDFGQTAHHAPRLAARLAPGNEN